MEQEKPELVPYELNVIKPLFFLEPEISGVSVFATREDTLDLFANAYGSGHWRLRFQGLAREFGDDTSPERQCALPIAPDRTEPRARISHRRGKQSTTHFRRLKTWRGYSLWEAETAYLRPHQIRVHAQACGLSFVGESRYTSAPPLYLSQLKRGYRPGQREEQPLHPGLCLHLEEVTCRIEGQAERVFHAPHPRKLGVLFQHLDRYRA